MEVWVECVDEIAVAQGDVTGHNLPATAVEQAQVGARAVNNVVKAGLRHHDCFLSVEISGTHPHLLSCTS